MAMDNTAICAALFDAFAQGDEATLRSLCHADMHARQNNGPAMDFEALLEFSRAVHGVLHDFRYEEPTRTATENGFVEEHRVCGRLPNGSELDLPVCVVAELRDGRVSQLREYLDLDAAKPLVTALN